MKFYIKLFVIVLMIGIGMVVSTEATAQCAMCRASVENSISDGGRMFGAGLNKGILYLMLMPYIVIAIIGYAWYRTSKKYTEKRRRLAQALTFRVR